MSDGSDPEMDTGEDFDPETDEDFTRTVSDIRDKTDAIKESLRTLCERDVYPRLETEDRVKHDIFLAYALTSLYWMYVRTQGLDPKENVVHTEIERLKEYIGRAKGIKARKTMPRIDKEASNRFIKSGLWTPGQAKRLNKRKRLDTEDED